MHIQRNLEVSHVWLLAQDIQRDVDTTNTSPLFCKKGTTDGILNRELVPFYNTGAIYSAPILNSTFFSVSQHTYMWQRLQEMNENLRHHSTKNHLLA
jgi:hypothetical protein